MGRIIEGILNRAAKHTVTTLDEKARAVGVPAGSMRTRDFVNYRASAAGEVFTGSWVSLRKRWETAAVTRFEELDKAHSRK